MADTDPVEWAAIEAVSGPPADDVIPYVDRLRPEVRGDPAPDAVKTIYDAWKRELGEDRSTSDQGAAYVIRYRLERKGAIDAGDDPAGSVVDRRPDEPRLREWFWENEETLWYVATRTGVHYALVSYWFWEDGIPLRERNLGEAKLDAVRRYRERRD